MSYDINQKKLPVKNNRELMSIFPDPPNEKEVDIEKS